MKLRVLLLITFTMLMLASVCSAHSLVRVSDYGTDGFYYRFNEIAPNGMVISNKPQLSMSNDTYDTYICTNGPADHVTTISFFANKEGYVSKIMIIGEANDSVAMNNLRDDVFTILTILGVNKGEMMKFMDSWNDSNNANIRHWCSASGRFILISKNINYDYNTFSATFTAAA